MPLLPQTTGSNFKNMMPTFPRGRVDNFVFHWVRDICHCVEVWLQVVIGLPGGGGTLILALGRQRQVDLCEFKASLVYKASSRTVRTVTQRNPVLKNQKGGKVMLS